MYKIKMKIFFVIFLFICNLAHSKEYFQAPDTFVKETIEALVDNYSNENWYGFYFIDKISGEQLKVGYARINYNIHINEKLERTFSENLFFKTIFKLMDDEYHSEGVSSYVYNAESPYNLINAMFSSVNDDGTSSYEIYKVENNISTYQLLEDNILTEKKVDNFTYSLSDYFAFMYAASKDDTKVGEKFETKWLDLGEETTASNEIEEISETNLYGSKFEYGKIKSLQKLDGLEEEIYTYVSANKFLTLVFADTDAYKFELRLESENDAKNLNNIKDLFIFHSINIDTGNLGSEPFDILSKDIFDLYSDKYENHEVIYEIIGDYNNIFEESHTNLKIFKNYQGLFLRIGDTTDFKRELVDQEFYDEAETYMENNPELNEIATNVISWTTDDAEKLDLLLMHMADYNYSNRLIEITDPYQILEYGGGDCTELSDLFISLVKSIGIPARRVTGYARQDNTFGGHQWAEVAYENEWWSVDPTWLLWTGFSADHLKIKDEDELGNIPFNLRISEINSTVSDFSVTFSKEGEVIYN